MVVLVSILSLCFKSIYLIGCQRHTSIDHLYHCHIFHKIHFSPWVLIAPIFLEIYSYTVREYFSKWKLCLYHSSSGYRIIFGQVCWYRLVGIMVATPSNVPFLVSGNVNYWYSVYINIGALVNWFSFTVSQ